MHCSQHAGNTRGQELVRLLLGCICVHRCHTVCMQQYSASQGATPADFCWGQLSAITVRNTPEADWIQASKGKEQRTVKSCRPSVRASACARLSRLPSSHSSRCYHKQLDGKPGWCCVHQKQARGHWNTLIVAQLHNCPTHDQSPKARKLYNAMTNQQEHAALNIG